MKILLVEDDLSVIETFSLSLQIKCPKAELILATLGRQSIEIMKRHKPDIVVLDIGLPDIDGFEVLKQVRAFSEVPIMVLSAFGEDTDIDKGLQLGADRYMVKPFSQAELWRTLKELAASKRKQGADDGSGPVQN